MEIIGRIMFSNKTEYRDFTFEEMQAYSFWYRFLQITDKNLWSEEVRNDFGDLSVGFPEWWFGHNHLFENVRLRTIDVINSVDDFESVAIGKLTEDDPGVVVLAVWMYQTKKDLRHAFEEILSKLHQSKPGKPKREILSEFYSLKILPDLDFLKKTLAVYECFSENKFNPVNKKLTLWQIEEEVSKTVPLIDKLSDYAEANWKDKKPSSDIILARRKSQTNTVKKYLKYANSILSNVVKGEFPIYTLDNKKLNNPQASKRK